MAGIFQKGLLIIWNFKRHHFSCVLIAVLAANQPAYSESVPAEQASKSGNPGGCHHVTVGVKDLDTALAQWIDMMGFEVRSRQEGPDTGLAALWQIKPEDIERQAIVPDAEQEEVF